MEILKQIKNQLINLNQRFFLILENFVAHYISYLQNPQNRISAQEIEHVKSVVNEINSQAFILKNQMEVKIDASQKLSNKLTNEIDVLQKENVRLQNKTKTLKKVSLTSEGLFDDELDWYRKQIKLIIVLLIGILICGKFFHSFKLDLKQNMIAIVSAITVGIIIDKIIVGFL